MFETIFNTIEHMPAVYVYLVLLVIPFIENIFPPSPSDLIVVICGSLISAGVINFIPALILSSIGSELGFLFLYYLGAQTDRKIIQKGKIRFIDLSLLVKAEDWFNRYGYAIILFNRFISGIRSIISYFAGLSELKFKRTLILSSISAVMWNVILLLLGLFFGNNIDVVDKWLESYSKLIYAVIALIVIGLLIRFIIMKMKSKKNAET